MEYVRLGKSGLRVSRLALGCMSYGAPDRGAHAWTLPEDQARPFIRQALEAGINYFDTANVYSDGSSEEILGRAVRDFARRDEVVLATKVSGPMNTSPVAGGLSRKEILAELDQSLRRLDTDYLDLYITHRWDPDTEIEETMEALHDAVKAGKVRYLGASNVRGYQLAVAQHAADLHGWTRYICVQNQYNLITREDEREVIPFALREGIGVTPWSPLARGLLTRDWGTETDRATKDDNAQLINQEFRAGTETADRAVAQIVATIADERGVSRAQIALAWLLAQPAVTAPIVGATKPHHLDDAVAALELALTSDELDRLTAPYVPHPIPSYY
ncbi:aldo/keto reductase [Nocardia terpenica]|uniref:Aldo/keto reductase n=1 Tax=Nocardia terpenica TaxID=455432 RepID=A0A6G9Z871_9NOCA|nr:aldo/keto reductase [Nocardia terpenica]QIS21366.1 aldo/keto reductase [Nocardia terpenica]